MRIMKSGKPPVHLHGSNLLIRADVEKEVGWNQGETVAEDQLFGSKAHEKYPRRLGWHGGLVLEQPPLTLGDHYRQRKRWVQGAVQNMKFLPRKLKTKIILTGQGIRIAGLLAALISIPLWFQTILALPYQFFGIKLFPSLQTPFLSGGELVFDLFDGDIYHYLNINDVFAIAAGILTLVNFSLWIGNYLIGVYFNNKMLSRLGLLKDWFLLALVIPVIGVIESYPILGAFKDTIRKKKTEWFVTPK